MPRWFGGKPSRFVTAGRSKIAKLSRGDYSARVSRQTGLTEPGSRWGDCMPTSCEPLLRNVLRDEALTRGLGDIEARMLVEWVADWTELLAEAARTEEDAWSCVERLCRRGPRPSAASCSCGRTHPIAARRSSSRRPNASVGRCRIRTWIPATSCIISCRGKTSIPKGNRDLSHSWGSHVVSHLTNPTRKRGPSLTRRVREMISTRMAENR